MRLIKRNKVLLVAIIAILLILFASFYSMGRLLFPNLGTPIYGKRIIGIEKVKIDNDRKADLIDKIKTNTNVDSVAIDVRGRLINFIIDVKENIEVNDAKNIGVKALNELAIAEKDYYDIQFFITQKAVEDNTLYPLLGYKNKISTTVVWTEK